MVWDDERNGQDFLWERLCYVLAFSGALGTKKTRVSKTRVSAPAARAGGGDDEMAAGEGVPSGARSGNPMQPLKIQWSPRSVYGQVTSEVRARVLSHLFQTYAFTWAAAYHDEMSKDQREERDNVLLILGAILACCPTTVTVRETIASACPTPFFALCLHCVVLSSNANVYSHF